MNRQPASGQFFAYQLQQSTAKPFCFEQYLLGKSFSSSFPYPPFTIFLIGRRTSNSCCSGKEEMTVSCIEKIRPTLSLAPMTSGDGEHERNTTGGSIAKGPGVLHWNSNLLLLAQPHNGISTHSSCRDSGSHCCLCLLKMEDATVAWLSPAP